MANHAPIQNPSTQPTAQPGGAPPHFLSNLNDRQRQHLQYAIPKTSLPERLSQFLETPRATPVPKRFTFEAMEARRHQAREARDAKRQSRSRRSQSRSRERNALPGQGQGGSGGMPSIPGTMHRYGGTAGRMMGPPGGEEKRGQRQQQQQRNVIDGEKMGRARAESNASTPSIDLLKPDEKYVEVEDVVDWRYHATGGCVFVLNLIVAWDATSLSSALPVSYLPHLFASLGDVRLTG